MRLILVWAGPVLLMLWTFAYQLLVTLPWTKTWLPIALPTLYLWIVDTLALRRGTWSIELGTKLGIHLWPHLEIEEAVFFLLTNMLVVWGAIAYDNAVGILDAFPEVFPEVPGTPSPVLLLKALCLPTARYDNRRIQGLNNALNVLAKKSRSFYLASGVFMGRLRIDLILLYGFCRVADDLIDNAPTQKDAVTWIENFSRFLDAIYAEKADQQEIRSSLAPFPKQAQSILVLLPKEKLPSAPLYALLDGFRIDQNFLADGPDSKATNPPIRTLIDLQRYATCVAATIGELCLSLVYYHDPDGETDLKTQQRCKMAGAQMGRALQYVNIVRDVMTDAQLDRSYIPYEWWDRSLPGEPDANREEYANQVLQHRKRILDIAFTLYAENRDAIEELPEYARAGIRVAVESYMEIGRVIRDRISKGQSLDFDGGGRTGRATVPKSRRVLVGWRVMTGWRGAS
ncbi:hypothetical protein B0A52_06312 [Exophiala mesophila]|uniref:Bifunctional lycopene cyclase/phytoene synthase n=1 Tax=Exophiala mesophila TaxID=212818 RepID=A0A438N323_EXOME|nr:hypothetical protein B0A52_06312 [Exophiala mesophila]